MLCWSRIVSNGVWEGTYRFITPHLQVVDQYDFRIDVSFPEDGKDGITYRQLSHYDWTDGRTGDIDLPMDRPIPEDKILKLVGQ